MSFIYKDIFTKLEKAGYNTYRLRQENILSESVLTNIRQNKPISMKNLSKLCELTGCGLADIIEYVKDK